MNLSDSTQPSKAVFWTIGIIAIIGVLVGTTLLFASSTIVKAQDATPTPAVAAQPAQSITRTVTVNGIGTVEAAPDIAVISLGVRTEADTAREALTLNNAQMQDLLDSLAVANVAEADIKTRTIQLQPRYAVTPPNETQTIPQVNGYIAINSVDVTVRNLTNLGSLLDTAVTTGSNQIDGIRFDISQQQESLNKAREAAMQDALNKARQLASLSGASLGSVVTINEYSSVPLMFDQMEFSRAAQGGESVPISPGSQSVQIDVQVTWELVIEQP